VNVDMQIALGPLLYYWTRERVFSFYDGIARSPVDIVYLGEGVCARRHELRLPDWLEIAAMLRAAGKQTVLSSQALIEAESDLNHLRRLVAEDGHLVEANDFGAVRLLSEAKRPFVAGPYLNVFNPPTLAKIASIGATRWVAPIEMSGAVLADLQASRPAGMQTEVFVFGRLPLAFSARCFTARHFNLQKDTCAFKCESYPEGLELRTRDGEPFLNINGTQTQSILTYDLIREVDEMREMGVDVLRISPQAEHTAEVIAAFASRVAPPTGSNARAALPAGAHPAGWCNGFWHGKAGLSRIEAAREEAVQ
jgi:collagenase-like PrtC family protease